MASPSDPASPSNLERVTCPHAEPCGGCPLITLPYGEQRDRKQARLVHARKRHLTLSDARVFEIAPATPITEYRTRAKLIAAPGGRLGLFARDRDHDVVDIPNCRVLSPALAKVASLLRARIVRDEAERGPLSAYDERGSGALRAVDLRELEHPDTHAAGVLVTLVVSRARMRDRQALELAARALAHEEPSILGVSLNLHRDDSPQVLGDETIVVAGVTSAPDHMGLSTHEATYGSFAQAHRGQTKRVHSTLIELLTQRRTSDRRQARPRVLDLYGGSGAMSLALAGAGADVYLVESFAPAVRAAIQSARAQRLSVDGEASDVTSAVRRLAEQGTHVDLVVANPPRRGIAPEAREQIARLGAPLLAYVSCDPDTLTRDLGHFTELGYRVTSLQPMDMIPLTDEVETVAVLARATPAAPRVLFQDEELLVVEKSGHEPTMKQGEYARSLLERVQGLQDAEAAIPLERIEVGTSGIVILARHKGVLREWQEALAAPTTRVEFIVGARGITSTKGNLSRARAQEDEQAGVRTRYRRLQILGGHSLLRVASGHMGTHPIRKGLAAIGHPVLGDSRYGHVPTNRFFEERHTLDRTFVHCARIELIHPRRGEAISFESELPGDLRTVLERLGGEQSPQSSR
jgi:23S rRNA (uracil1939-C5)-methyltransferase